MAFTSRHSVEGMSLCFCVLFRSIGRGLLGSVRGHKGCQGDVCACVCVCVWYPGERVSESTRRFMAGQRTMLQWDLSVEGSLTCQHLQVTEID